VGSHRPKARKFSFSLRRRHEDDGVTLVEVMIAFAVLMIVMVPLGYLLTNEVGQAAQSRNQLSALDLAEKWVEILGTAQDPPPRSGSLGVHTNAPLIPQLPNGTSVPTETRGNTVYTLRSEYTWANTEDPKDAPDLCASGAAQVLNLTVTVSWNNDNNQVTDTTILDFPAPGIPQYGFYRLQVSGDTGASDAGGNAWSARVQAVPVTITQVTGSGSPITNVVYPDQYGCVFAELTPANYTVSIADPVPSGPPNSTGYGSPSFVEDLATNGSPTEPTTITPAPTGTPVTITAGVTTSLTTVYYDEGSTIGLTYPSSTATVDGVTCPAAGQITCISEGEGTPASEGLAQGAASASMAWTSGAAWSSASVPSSAGVTRIASTACAGTTACIGVGYGYTGGTAHGVILKESATTPGTVTADGLPNGVTSLTNVICPSATACVAWGTGSSGPVILAGTVPTTGIDTWNLEGIPASITTLSQVTCTSALACVAVGNSATAGLIASGPIYGTLGAPTAGTWVLSNAVSGVTLSTVTQVACPAILACMATATGKIGTGAVGPLVISGSPVTPLLGLGSVLNWTLDAAPTGATPTSYSELVCPSSSLCLVVGNNASQAIIYSGAPAVATLTADSVSSTVTSLAQLVCPSTTVCVAIGTSTTGPVILSGSIGSPDTWSPSVPSGLTSVSAISCPNASTCAVAATSTSGSNPVAAILYGAPGTAATWTSAALPTADASTVYLTGISCTTTSGTATCAATGTMTIGAVIMMSTAGPAGPWTDHSADTGLSLTGSPTSNIPIEFTNGSNPGVINPSGNGAWNPVPATPIGTANAASLTNIYPLNGGNNLFAGDCTNEDVTNGLGSVSPNTIPGELLTTPGNTPSTVPLAVLPIQVTAPTGSAEAGDTLTLTAKTSGCANDTYDLQSTGPDGLSRTEVPFGAYTLTATLSSGGAPKTYSVTVAPGTVTIASTTFYLPQVASVVGP
jgi:type II secretory pathway pseudopilin PulG